MDTRVTQASMTRRKLAPFIDFSAFFLFFGISGTDRNRQHRLDERFVQEYYPCQVTALLSPGLPPGLYRLEGLPAEANKRGWRSLGGTRSTADLSEEAWQELEGWLRRGNRRVRAIRVTED